MTYLGKGNFNRRGFGASLGAVKVKLFFLVMMGAALGSVQAQGGGEGQEEEEGPVLPVVPVLNQVIPDQELRAEDESLRINLGEFFGVEEIRDEVVRLSAEWLSIDGSAGSAELDFLLFRDRTPGTVENFLGYVSRGDYTNMFVHRLVPNFVIQGGGFQVTNNEAGRPMVTEVPVLEPIVNEFGVSNTLGTISMAKLGGDPDSATSQWFISTGANSDNLDNQNGGFTVFGRVSQGTFTNAQLLNSRADFSLFNLQGALSATPLVMGTSAETFAAERFYRFRSVEEVPLPAGQAGVSRELSYEPVALDLELEPELSIIGENLDTLEVMFPAATRGGRRTIQIRGEDSVGNQVEDRFELLLLADYEAWRRAVFSAEELADEMISGPLADPNGDGVSNLIVFVQGLPEEGDVSQQVTRPSFVISDEVIRLEIETGFVTGMTFQLEGSDNLDDWESLDATVLETNQLAGRRVQFSLSGEELTRPKRFYRIRYLLN